MEIPDYKIVSTDELIPYARNSRIHSPEQVAQIAASIKEFGFLNPIIVDGTKGIIAGHGRVMAAQKLGIEQLPCIEAGHLTEAQRKAHIIADNKLALNAGLDNDLLKIELDELAAMGFDVTLTGFDLDEIDLLGMTEEETKRELNSEKYTANISTPIYEIKGERPELAELVCTKKYQSLLEQVHKSEITDDVKDFLIMAAARHLVFDYEKIAEFYAHADADIKNLMESSALVIIDYKRAVEDGYVKLTYDLMKLSGESDE